MGSANAEVDLSDVDYIDLGGLILDGRAGSTGIRFRPGYEPVKYQFGTAATGPWHDTMEANDKYRRDSLDGGTTWGSAYQFKGSDGRNGSDANVPAYIQSTYIDATKVESFQIRGNKIEALCPPSDNPNNGAGFMLTGAFYHDTLNYLQIYAKDAGTIPLTVFTSQSRCPAVWDFFSTTVRGPVDFADDVSFNGKVSGVTATFA